MNIHTIFNNNTPFLNVSSTENTYGIYENTPTYNGYENTSAYSGYILLSTYKALFNKNANPNIFNDFSKQYTNFINILLIIKAYSHNDKILKYSLLKNYYLNIINGTYHSYGYDYYERNNDYLSSITNNNMNYIINNIIDFDIKRFESYKYNLSDIHHKYNKDHELISLITTAVNILPCVKILSQTFEWLNLYTNIY